MTIYQDIDLTFHEKAVRKEYALAVVRTTFVCQC